MIQVTAATFEDGVFKPDNPVPLEPNTRVRLSVETLDDSEKTRQEAWNQLEQLWRHSAFDSQGDRLSRINSMNAVDTNILLYSIDRHEPVKQLKAQQLLQQLRVATDPTYLLWQVLGESVQQLRRWKDQGKITAAEFANHVQIFRHLFPLVLPVPAVLDHALDLADRYSLSHWDSMILGACREAAVTTFYTEDMGAPRVIDNIHLVNPVV